MMICQTLSMNRLSHVFLTLVALIAVLSNRVHAQSPSPSQNNKEISETLHSDILNEDRSIQVFLPDSYKTSSSEKYDVIYVIDGEMLARYFPPIRSFDEENDIIAPVIIVGIKNNYWYNISQDSRDRDLLPVPVAGSPLSGSADKFITFLKTELIPYINRNYPTTGKATLFGHSYGGMFTMYAFLTQPELFDSYIASDPALWWNDGYVIHLAEKRLRDFPKVRKTLYIGGRSGRMYEAFGIEQMTTLLKSSAPSTLRWESVAHEDEDHGSVRLKNIYDGLKFTYFGRSPDMLDFFPRNGIVVKGKPASVMIYSTYLNQYPGIRYTTDGSEPTETSPRFDYGVPVNGPIELTVKQFSNWGADKIARGHFQVGSALPAVVRPTAVKPGGLRYSYFEGNWERMPDLSGSAPTKSGLADQSFSVSHFAGSTPSACRLDGYFEATKDGYYVFFLEADDTAKLFIDHQLLMDVDVRLNKATSTSFLVPLTKGFHAIRIEYFHKAGETNLKLTYLSPTANGATLAHLPTEIPPELWFSH